MDTLRRLMLWKKASGGSSPLYERTIINNPAVFTTEVARPLKGLLIPFMPKQSGTGDPSPSNIRPITGWTGLNINRTGKNIADFTVRNQNGITATKSNGEAVISGTASADAFPVNLIAIDLKAGTYTFSVNGLETGTRFEYSINGEWAGVVSTTKTFTIQNESRIAGYVIVTTGTEVDTTITVSLEVGATATAYEPYTGTTIPVSWQSEAGTVYGGTLNALTGVLTVEWKGVDLGSLTYLYYEQYKFFNTNIPDRKKGVTNIIANTFDTEAGSWDGTIAKENIIWGNGSNGSIYIQLSAYTDVQEFTNWLNEISAFAVYELDTPQIVQLDPVTLSTLIGENVIWTDTNGDNTIKYLSKTQGGGLGGGLGGGFGGGSDEPDEPLEPDEPQEPEET